MLRRHKTLTLLHEELRTLALFDKVYDYAPNPDPAADHAYAVRQIRRSQIIAEINKRSRSKPDYRIGSAVLLLCAVGYATLHYLIK